MIKSLINPRIPGRLIAYARGAIANRVKRSALTGNSRVVVSLTTHGDRLTTVHHTIESIARGRVRPRRLVLALDSQQDAAKAASLPTIERLRRRGLEILVVPPMGPHAKYFAYIAKTDVMDVPLVTADDDILYPRDWLVKLLAAHATRPDVIHCFRAHEFGIDLGRPLRYEDWQPVSVTEPRFSSFLTGVSGVIYPPVFLDRLREAGEGFRSVAPKADDVWLHSQAVAAGIKVAQIEAAPKHFPVLIGSQVSALWRHNTATHDAPSDGTNGGTANDVQIAASYSRESLDRIATEAADASPG